MLELNVVINQALGKHTAEKKTSYIKDFFKKMYKYFFFRHSSIRYVPEGVTSPKRQRTISIKSDYNEGRDRIVTTDMTMVLVDISFG